MRHLHILLIMGASALLFSCSGKQDKPPQQENLFAEDQQNWFEDGDATWQFSSGELVGQLDSGAGFVMTKDKYQDFILQVEFNPDSTINSGIFIRCANPALSAEDCYEINIWDLHPNQDYRTGAIVLRSKPINYVETLNQWNTYMIRAEKNRIQAWINGIQTADLIDEQLDGGYIVLQAAGNGQIRFRNVKISTLDSPETP